MSNYVFLKDEAEHQTVKESFLYKWINNQMNKRTWEDEGISEIKYLISFMPLFDMGYGDRKSAAKNLGVKYGVLRKFLSEAKVKQISKRHLKEFSNHFCNKLILLPVNEPHFESLLDEFRTSFSESLLCTIFKTIKIRALKHFSRKENESGLSACAHIYPLMLMKYAEKVRTVDRKKYLLARTMLLELFLSMQGLGLSDCIEKCKAKQKANSLLSDIDSLIRYNELAEEVTAEIVELCKSQGDSILSKR
jgi:hypothetical protein